ncbi:hypothetical protein L0F63_002406 [Massospora cicadina]|nr:hypothetical protein L0F63_002406 [Massospora cicadina]
MLEDFCEVCFDMLHRTGRRKLHTHKPLEPLAENDATALKDQPNAGPPSLPASMEETVLGATEINDLETVIGSADNTDPSFGEWIKERSLAQFLSDNAEFFRSLFEIGRRYKIMNPERMRSAYGKLMFMLQDSALPEVQEMLGFACVAPIKTVYRFLQERDGLDLLNHEYVMLATKEIIAEGKSPSAIQSEIKQKGDIRNCLYSIGDNHAYLRANRDPCDLMLKYLTTHFSTTSPAEAEFTLAIRNGRSGARLSHSHETQYHYVHQTLTLWREIFHEMFMLWYYADADLLSSTTSYRLRDTGQGLNRVQACPGVSKIAHRLLHRAQKKVGYWVGSSVIHLGDHNVPNALVFIDKYNQVARILNPIARCLEYLDNLENRRKMRPYDQGLIRYIESTFKSIAYLRKLILADFFRGAFDGSGADNFFDAGSCIDGRLTSAWNWCSLIEKKSFYPVFLMTGFVGFDGEWAGN